MQADVHTPLSQPQLTTNPGAFANTHPVFANMLQQLTRLPQQVAPASLSPEQAYRRSLANFDWTFDASDDPLTWQHGHNALSRLRAEQSQVDPSGAIWLQHLRDHGLDNNPLVPRPWANA